MTEADWRATTDAEGMLVLLARRRKRLRFNPERFRTFAVLCARRMWPHLSEPLRELVARLDGNAADVTPAALRRGRQTHESEAVKYGQDYTLASANRTAGIADYRPLIELSICGPARLVAGFLALRWPYRAALSAVRNGPRAAGMAERLAALQPERELGQEDFSAVVQLDHSTAEQTAQADLVRCVFGNPFRWIEFDPAWRTEAAVALARGMDESRDFAALPVLADALEDAGCDAAELLAHCRGGGPHARGCHAIDHVLGRW